MTSKNTFLTSPWRSSGNYMLPRPSLLSRYHELYGNRSNLPHSHSHIRLFHHRGSRVCKTGYFQSGFSLPSDLISSTTLSFLSLSFSYIFLASRFCWNSGCSRSQTFDHWRSTFAAVRSTLLIPSERALPASLCGLRIE